MIIKEKFYVEICYQFGPAQITLVTGFTPAGK
jgi:hypothetical protein